MYKPKHACDWTTHLTVEPSFCELLVAPSVWVVLGTVDLMSHQRTCPSPACSPLPLYCVENWNSHRLAQPAAHRRERLDVTGQTCQVQTETMN